MTMMLTALTLVYMYLRPGRWWRMLDARRFVRTRRELGSIAKGVVQ